MSDIPPFVFDLIREKKKLQKQLSEIESKLKEHIQALGEVMDEVDINEIEIEDHVIERVKPYSYKRFKSFKSVVGKHPEIVSQYPDIVTEVNVKGYVKVKSKN